MNQVAGSQFISADVSVVVPIHNESATIVELSSRVIAAVGSTGSRAEIILVDDGSTDESPDLIAQLADQHAEVVGVRLARNFGQSAALAAGIAAASGSVIVTIDGDLQNIPEDIPLLLAEIDAGYDVVSGWREDRKDALLSKRVVSRVANRLISWATGVKLNDYGCTLKAYRSEVLKPVRLYGEMHRFLPVYCAWQGARIREIPVRHRQREHGRSHYGLDRIVKVVLDLLVVKFLDRYLTKPMYVFGSAGLLSMAASLAVLVWAVFLRVSADVALISTPLLLVAATLGLAGVLAVLTGLLSELISRTYFESQGRDPYIVRSSD